MHVCIMSKNKHTNACNSCNNLWVNIPDRCIKFEISGTHFPDHQRLEGTYTSMEDPQCPYRYNNTNTSVQDVLFAYEDRVFENDHAIGKEPCNYNR